MRAMIALAILIAAAAATPQEEADLRTLANVGMDPKQCTAMGGTNTCIAGQNCPPMPGTKGKPYGCPKNGCCWECTHGCVVGKGMCPASTSYEGKEYWCPKDGCCQKKESPSWAPTFANHTDAPTKFKPVCEQECKYNTEPAQMCPAKFAPDGKTQFKCPKSNCCAFTKQKTPAPTKPSNHTKTPAPTKPSNHTKTPAPTKPHNNTKTPAPTTAAPSEGTASITQLKIFSKDNWDSSAFLKDLADTLKWGQKNESPGRFEVTDTKTSVSKRKGYKQEVTATLKVKPAKDEKDVGTPAEIVADIEKLASGNGTVIGKGAFLISGGDTSPPTTAAPTKNSTTLAPTKNSTTLAPTKNATAAPTAPPNSTSSPTSSSAVAVPTFVGVCAALFALSRQ